MHARRGAIPTAFTGLLLAACTAAPEASSADSSASPADVHEPSGDVARAGDAAPACDPTVQAKRLWLGINDLPESMLGLQPVRYNKSKSTFHWAVPPTSWTIDVHLEHPPGWCPQGKPDLLWGALEGEGPAPLGTKTPAGQWLASGPSEHVWQAAIQSALPGGVGLAGLRAGLGGLNSEMIQVQVAHASPDIHPFDKVDNWAVVFSRDLSKLSVSHKGDKFKVATLKPGTPDGQADFDEAMAALGFYGGDEPFNAAVRKLLLARVLRWLRTFYLLDPDTGEIGPQSVRIRLLFEGHPDVPPAADRAGLGWSQIAVGGEDPGWKEGGQTFFGRAEVDWHNKVANDDTQPDLGVFTTALVRMVLTNSAGAALLKGYAPASGGAPFGSMAGDQDFVLPDFDANALPPGRKRNRGLQFGFVSDLLSLALAAITAHEIGHSLGMVRSGLPPKGMLADVQGPWAVQQVPGGHIDTPGFNLMQTGSSFSFGDLVSGPPAFSASNLGYLRGRLLML